MWKEKLKEYYENNKGKTIGLICGILFGILVLIIGFFRTLFIFLCALLGYYVGKKVDNNESILEVIERILPNRWK